MSTWRSDFLDDDGQSQQEVGWGGTARDKKLCYPAIVRYSVPAKTYDIGADAPPIKGAAGPDHCNLGVWRFLKGAYTSSACNSPPRNGFYSDA